MASQEAQVTKFCSNCHADVPEVSFSMHEAFCLRHNKRCERCDTTFPKAEFDKHIEEDHAEITCPECYEKMEAYQLDDHQEEQCPKREVQCPYCDLKKEHRELAEHTDHCGARTDECERCGERVRLCDMERHNQTKHGDEGNSNASRAGDEDASAPTSTVRPNQSPPSTAATAHATAAAAVSGRRTRPAALAAASAASAEHTASARFAGAIPAGPSRVTASPSAASTSSSASTGQSASRPFPYRPPQPQPPPAEGSVRAPPPQIPTATSSSAGSGTGGGSHGDTSGSFSASSTIASSGAGATDSDALSHSLPDNRDVEDEPMDIPPSLISDDDLYGAGGGGGFPGLPGDNAGFVVFANYQQLPPAGAMSSYSSYDEDRDRDESRDVPPVTSSTAYHDSVTSDPNAIPVQCQYCDKQVTIGELDEHEEVCIRRQHRRPRQRQCATCGGLRGNQRHQPGCPMHRAQPPTDIYGPTSSSYDQYGADYPYAAYPSAAPAYYDALSGMSVDPGLDSSAPAGASGGDVPKAECDKCGAMIPLDVLDSHEAICAQVPPNTNSTSSSRDLQPTDAGTGSGESSAPSSFTAAIISGGSGAAAEAPARHNLPPSSSSTATGTGGGNAPSSAELLRQRQQELSETQKRQLRERQHQQDARYRRQQQVQEQQRQQASSRAAQPAARANLFGDMLGPSSRNKFTANAEDSSDDDDNDVGNADGRGGGNGERGRASDAGTGSTAAVTTVPSSSSSSSSASASTSAGLNRGRGAIIGSLARAASQGLGVREAPSMTGGGSSSVPGHRLGASSQTPANTRPPNAVPPRDPDPNGNSTAADPAAEGEFEGEEAGVAVYGALPIRRARYKATSAMASSSFSYRSSILNHNDGLDGLPAPYANRTVQLPADDMARQFQCSHCRVFCGSYIARGDHEEACSLRKGLGKELPAAETAPCEYCKEPVKLKDLYSHEYQCIAKMAVEKREEYDAMMKERQESMDLTIKDVESMGDRLSALQKTLKEHGQSLRRPATAVSQLGSVAGVEVPCEYCKQTFRMSQVHTHQLTCAHNPSTIAPGHNAAVPADSLNSGASNGFAHGSHEQRSAGAFQQPASTHPSTSPLSPPPPGSAPPAAAAGGGGGGERMFSPSSSSSDTGRLIAGSRSASMPPPVSLPPSQGLASSTFSMSSAYSRQLDAQRAGRVGVVPSSSSPGASQPSTTGASEFSPPPSASGGDSLASQADPFRPLPSIGASSAGDMGSRHQGMLSQGISSSSRFLQQQQADRHSMGNYHSIMQQQLRPGQCPYEPTATASMPQASPQPAATGRGAGAGGGGGGVLAPRTSTPTDSATRSSSRAGRPLLAAQFPNSASASSSRTASSSHAAGSAGRQRSPGYTGPGDYVATIPAGGSLAVTTVANPDAAAALGIVGPVLTAKYPEPVSAQRGSPRGQAGAGPASSSCVSLPAISSSGFSTALSLDAVSAATTGGGDGIESLHVNGQTAMRRQLEERQRQRLLEQNPSLVLGSSTPMVTTHGQLHVGGNKSGPIKTHGNLAV